MHMLRVVLGVFVLSLGLMAADSPFTGTWKLNVSKSKLSPAPESETVNVDADDQSIKVNIDGINEKGQPVKNQYKAKFDGKDYPMSGVQEGNTISFQRVDANTLKATTKKGGKVIGEFTVVVSKDGKTATTNFTETSAEGKTIKGTAVYDKQ